ncbi:hypothetical protein MBLNU230_g5341t1 [Neophaeotheca triangularis]
MKFALALVSLTALVGADDTSCPLNSTSTRSYDRTTTSRSTFWVDAVTPLPSTTITLANFETTGTVTSTVPGVTTFFVCETTTTEFVDHVPTAYTGNFSSSSLRASTSCAPQTTVFDEYLATETVTPTFTRDEYTVTEYYTTPYEATYEVTSGLSTTTTQGNRGCTHTVTSATATAATSTQDLKCAPSNLIGTDGKAGEPGRASVADGIASYGSGASTPEGFQDRAGAHKDASACCQACQDDPSCKGSLFAGFTNNYPTWRPPFCQHWLKDSHDDASGTCGIAFTIFPGDQAWGQTGCGVVAENVYAPGPCSEGMSPRQCQRSAGREIR